MYNWLDPSRPKLPPGALFAIPDDLLADIYTIWLRLKDVCRLDTAVCSKIWRPPFLRLVSTKVLRFNREEIDVLDGFNLSTTTHMALRLPTLNWILKRGIHLASLRLPDLHKGNEAEKKSIRAAVSSLVSEGRLDKLETIDFKCCSYIKDVDLAAILTKSYASMKSVDIRYYGLAESSVAYIKRCTGLEAFAAQGNESTFDMVEIFQSCRKLRKLNLSLCYNILTDEVVQSVAAHCRFLEHLNIGGCYAVSEAAIIRVAKNLLFLNLSRTKITDSSLEKIGKHCSNLRVLWIVGCADVTCEGLVAFANTYTSVRKVCMDHALRENRLILSYTHVSWFSFSTQIDSISIE